MINGELIVDNFAGGGGARDSRMIILSTTTLRDIHIPEVSRCAGVAIQSVHHYRLQWYAPIFRSCVWRRGCRISLKIILLWRKMDS